MDSSSAAAEMVTLCAASGYAVHFFPTGQGNIIGNPILPVIKLCANPRTVRTMSEHIDVDVSGLLRKELTMDGAGDALLEMMLRTANGRWTAAEGNGSSRVCTHSVVRKRLTLQNRPSHQEESVNIKPGTGWLVAASLLFILFIANILLGKAALAPDFETPLKLGDVGEFLVLFATVICFIAGVLRREAYSASIESSKDNMPPPLG